MSEFLSACPQCRQKIVCDTQYVGMRVVCPLCKQEIVVPSPPEPSLPKAASAVSSPGNGGKRVSWWGAAAVAGMLVLVVAGAGYWLATGNRSRTAIPDRGGAAPALPTSSAAAVPGLLSEGKTVYASSFEAGNFPNHGNDGDQTTRWTAQDDHYPQWWVVDLGASRPLSRAVIDWYNNGPRHYGYRIDISQDNSNYSTVVNKPDNTTSGTTTDVLSGTAKYVRITVLSCHPSGKYAAFYEARIYGN